MNNLFPHPAARLLKNLSLLHKFLLIGISLALPTLVLASLVYLESSGQIILPQLARYGLWLALVSNVTGLFLLASLYLNTALAINMLSAAIARFAKGDLAARAKLNSRDEFGQAAAGFNTMAKAIKVIIANVSSQAVDVSGAVTQLSRQTSQIASSSQQQSEAAQAMASAVEEVTASIAQVAAQTTDTQAVSQRASDLSSQGTAVVEQAAAEMHRISDVFQQSSAQLEVLGAQTQEISTIAQLIKEIADQTNLLALNPAIEAARAGEQGRGFAVVADEVRSLAGKTAGATNEITSTISAIQKKMQQATDSMHAGANQVKSGKELAQQAGCALQNINQGSQEALTKVHEIADAMNAQNEASHHIAENVEHISVMTRENSQSLQQISSAATQLDTSSQQLREAISAFSGGTAEDAQKLVEKAARLVQQDGEQATFVRINDPFGDLVVRDLYIFAYNLKGDVLAHGGNPALAGKNMHDAQDPQGKYFVRERIAIAEGDGQGWQDYMFRNPETGEEEGKTSYILRVNDIILGCGVYK